MLILLLKYLAIGVIWSKVIILIADPYHQDKEITIGVFIWMALFWPMGVKIVLTKLFSGKRA